MWSMGTLILKNKHMSKNHPALRTWDEVKVTRGKLRGKLTDELVREIWPSSTIKVNNTNIDPSHIHPTGLKKPIIKVR